MENISSNREPSEMQNPHLEITSNDKILGNGRVLKAYMFIMWLYLYKKYTYIDAIVPLNVKATSLNCSLRLFKALLFFTLTP